MKQPPTVTPVAKDGALRMAILIVAKVYPPNSEVGKMLQMLFDTAEKLDQASEDEE